MAMLALAIGHEKGTVNKEYYQEISQALLKLPETLEDVLKIDAQVEDLAKIFTYAHNFIYLGRGYNYPTALEGALKLKEISYIHAEGYPAAEMKHGPIALIDAEMPVVSIATPDHTYEKSASNIEEVKSRGRQNHRCGRSRRRTGSQTGRLRHRSSGHHRLSDADRRIHSVAVVGLLHRRQQRTQRRPAPKPRQVGYGRIGKIR